MALRTGPLGGTPNDDKDNTTPIEQLAVNMIRNQKSQWEDGLVFVTEKVAFDMKELIRTLRKNYYGVFDETKDPQTGREKTWYPLTETVVEFSVKNIDLDTKDINFRAKHPGAIGLTHVVRSGIENQLGAIFFGEKLDKMERQLCIDGTVVWKSIEYKDDNGKPALDVREVDLINFWIDPTANCIQEADCIERALMTPDEFQSMSGWDKKDDVTSYPNLSRNDENLRQNSQNVEMVEVYEWWGKMPKMYLTGKDEDEDEYVDGHIVVSNLNQNPIVHLIEKNRKGVKPYEECWYSRVPGRWYGRGPAERVLMLQLWMNTIINIRINRSYLSQLGIFKVRDNSGISAQMLSRLPVNGAIKVRNMDDIEQMVMQEASQSSYADEANINNIAEKVTQTFEAVTGESLPSSTSATGIAVQARSAQTAFTYVKEGIGIFLQRWMKRHALPIFQKRLTTDEIVRITGEIEDIREMDELMVNRMLFNAMEKMNKSKELFSLESVVKERERLLNKQRSKGRDRFVKITNSMKLTDYDIEMFVTNEEIDKNVLIQNLTQALQVAGNIPNIGIDPADIIRQIFDIAGLEPPRQKQQLQASVQGQVPPAPDQTTSKETPTEQNVLTKALTQGVSAV